MSNFYNQASWVLVPSGIEEDIVFAQKPISGLGDLTFTRASDATYTDSTGVVRRSPYNLLTFSEDFSNAAWTKLAASISSNVTTAPNGLLTADKLVEDTTNASHTIFQNISISASTNYNYSVYLKAAERFRFRIRFTGFSGAQDNAVDLNLGTAFAGTLTSVGNGWFRLTWPINSGTGAGSPIVAITLQDAAGNSTYLGNGTSGAFLWGAQLVEGTSSLDYFPTTDRLNVPRIDFRNADGTLSSCGRLLLEPQRTNLTLWSDDFTNVAYSKTNATVVANTTTAPDNTTSADSLVETATNGFHLISRGVFPIGTNTLSIYAKANTRNFIYIALFNGTSDFGAYFNLSNGTIGTIDAGVTAVIQPAGNGFYRCSVTLTSAAGTTLSIGIAQANGTRIYTGNGTSSVFIWGAQVEAGAYPTTYIPTTTAAVTRLADTASKTGVSSLIGQTEGTLFAEFAIKTVSEARRIFCISDGSISNRVVLAIETSNQFRVLITNGGVQQFSSLISATNGTNKLAVSYKANDFSFYLNGVQVFTQLSGSVPLCSDVYLGKIETSSSSLILADGIAQAALFPTRLTNAQLAQLTTL